MADKSNRSEQLGASPATINPKPAEDREPADQVPSSDPSEEEERVDDDDEDYEGGNAADDEEETLNF